MANFVLSTKPRAQWHGGPPAFCHVCNFPDASNKKGYLILEGVKVLMHDNIEVDLHLCIDQHATELQSVLNELNPDPDLTHLKGKCLSAEAARARAEKRAEKAEAALFAMQDWVSEKPAVVSPGGK